MSKLFQPFYSPDEPAGGSSGTTPEQALAQVQQQLTEIKEKYNGLQTQVEKGQLVKPEEFLKTKVEAGEIFPKERFTGLQQSFQAEQDAHLATKKSLVELQGSYTEQGTKLQTFETQVTTLTGQVQEKDTKVAELSKRNKRSNIIMEKYPALAGFEAAGLLPDAEEEKLDEVFSAFNSKISALGAEGALAFASGGGKTTPASGTETKPPSTAAVTAEAHRKLSMEAFSQGDMPEYNKEYDLYLKALSIEKT